MRYAYVCARSRYGAMPLAYEYWLIEERMCMYMPRRLIMSINQIWISKVSGCFHSWMKYKVVRNQIVKELKRHGPPTFRN